MKKLITYSAFIATLVNPLSAAAIDFDFEDPKGVNAISFHLDSLLEPISGTAGGITGTISFDPQNPASLTGEIIVATSSLTVTNDKMREHLLGDGWLDAPTNPKIKFDIQRIDAVKTDGNTTTATAVGAFTLKGVTQMVSVPVKITHLAGAFGRRLNKPEMGGDLLVVRGKFSISRSDYGIRPGQNEDKVADTIELSLALVGGAPGA